MLIAGHARSEGLIFVTNNTRQFVRIEDLEVENLPKIIPFRVKTEATKNPIEKSDGVLSYMLWVCNSPSVG